MDDRSQLIIDILDILRQQIDSKREVSLNGEIDVNPEYFATGKHLVIGPLDFGTSFESPPFLSFVQYGPSVDTDVRIQTSATNYTPFLVQPYVYGWKWENGAVDGFYIGMYALTDPKELPANNKLAWRAIGRASRYLSPIGQEIWATEDSSFRPSYLTEDST